MKNHLEEIQGHPGQVTLDCRTSITQDSKSVVFQIAGGEIKLIGRENATRWLLKVV